MQAMETWKEAVMNATQLYMMYYMQPVYMDPYSPGPYFSESVNGLFFTNCFDSADAKSILVQFFS